jgi:hypothetical protein
MDFGSPSFGSISRKLTAQYRGLCPPGKSLDDCELRASSPTDVRSLRVKTGEPSFFGRAKVRVAHRENAIRLVKESTLDKSSQSEWVDYSGIGQLKTKHDEQTGVKYEALTLRDLKSLEPSFVTQDPFAPAPVTPDPFAPAPLSRSPYMPRLECVAYDALPVSLREETPEARSVSSTDLIEASFRTPPDRDSKRGDAPVSTESTAPRFRTPVSLSGSASVAAGSSRSPERDPTFHLGLSPPNPALSFPLPPKKRR